MAQAKKIVIANWKMNPPTSAEAKKLFGGIKRKVSSIRGVQTIVCPPFVFLTELTQSYSGSKISFGAQDVFFEQKGSFTGEVSAAMLTSVGAQYVIIGHSERRALGEDNEDIAKKVKAALKEGLRIILCIGEHERSEDGAYLSFLKEELITALSGVSQKDISKCIIAYEPIWAIGKSAKDAMQPRSVHEMSIYIRKILTEKYNKQKALTVPILYGGSVGPTNVEALAERGAINGFLVGGASLDPESFAFVVKSMQN